MDTPHSALKKYFGYDEFRLGQEEVVHRVLNGQPTLLVMPTGSGKSLTYQLPALMLEGLTLVISPLIALMKDQVDGLNRAGISATFINSSLPLHELNQRMRAVQEGYVKLLYIAPERLRNSHFTRQLARTKISLLAIDEAHCISQWGHDFRPDYLRIAPTWQAMGQPTLLATTATATPTVQDEIMQILGINRIGKAVVAGFNRPNLSFRVKHTPDDRSKNEALLTLMKQTTGSVIVYVATRRNAEEVADVIRTMAGKSAQAYHGGMDRVLRGRVQDDFIQDRIQTVVATNAFGMGVDKPNVRLVLHYNLPANLEAYYQEAGRAGRDSGPAECIMLYAPNDYGLQEWMIKNDTPTKQELNDLYFAMSRRVREGEINASINELSDLSGLHPSKVRISVSELEIGGMLMHMGTNGFVNQWRVLPLSRKALSERSKAIAQRTENRLKMLHTMVSYAQLTTCRRVFMLNYFGDHSPPDAPRCCDNHFGETIDSLPKATTKEEWYPLIIIETARSLARPVGRSLLSQILIGSSAQKVRKFNYDQHKFHGKLDFLSGKQVTKLVDQLISHRYLQLVGGDYPTVQVTELGQKAIKLRAAIPLSLPDGPAYSPSSSKSAKPKRSSRGSTLDTVAESYALLEQGLSVAEIAQQRGLKETTVYGHMVKLLADETVSLRQIVPADVAQQIVAAIAQIGETSPLFPIKSILPDSISYEQIRCVVTAYPARARQWPSPRRDQRSGAAYRRPRQQRRPNPSA